MQITTTPFIPKYEDKTIKNEKPIVKVDDPKPVFNELRLAYTGKPENKEEEEYLKMMKEKMQRNW